MKKSISILSAFLLLAVCQLQAQDRQADIKPFREMANYRIGEVLSGLPIEKIINYNRRSANTADFRDRLLILDFWGLNCTNCIKAMPHMDSLQKQFGNKIMIFPITPDPENMIAPFWKKNKYTRNLSLPSAVDDKIVNSYFEKSGFPHEVWIYKGKVVAITDGPEVTSKNIELVLSGQQNTMPVKNDFYAYNARKEPLFKPDGNQVDTAVTPITYAAISGFKSKDGVDLRQTSPIGIVRNARSKTVRLVYLNNSIFDLYNTFWLTSRRIINQEPTLVTPLSGGYVTSPNTVIWEVGDKTKYSRDYREKEISTGIWQIEHSICFESQYKDSGQSDGYIYKRAIMDLDHLLGLRVRWEKRKEKVLVLVKKMDLDRFKTKRKRVHDPVSREDNYDTYVEKGELHQLRDNSLYTIILKLNSQASNPYVFDETGYKENLDLDLKFASWTDIDGVRKALKPYGLELREEERLVDKFVFSEVDGGLVIDRKMQLAAQAKKDAQKGMADPSPEENKTFLAANKMKAGVTVLPSGLQYKVIKKGTGEMPTLNSKVRVHYTGTLVNGKIFANSAENGLPSPWKITGNGESYRGFNEALQMMPVGSKWIIYLPEEIAFGEHTHAFSGRVPPHSTVILEVELLGIDK